MLTLYTFPHSRSLRATWMLEELGLEYRCEHVALDKGEGRSAAHLARHPDGKLPVLEDGALVLFESVAICRYLAERYGGEATLLPKDAAERAQVDQWLSFIVTELEQPLWNQAKHTFALPEERRVAAIIPTCAWEFERALKALERRYTGGEYLVGDAFSLADLFLTHTLQWAGSMKHRLPQALLDYRDHHGARPALARALEREKQAVC
ncbi:MULTISPECIES: glutathione S-transferase family protein [unclassified Halomonas]|uniref:glutathione S-transferase family protein n=1 Tax=unclassified Halomonas TaxID=2609666 RepID=UPI00209F5ED2|nr:MULTISPECIES: glutathione S-transferase family protein [unclassified Halomonas]MCP1314189.1 glutathione S-transferase family protein [Halomonas sp. 707D7]MCP1328256.1 glutathione S-transferase family protein [Halomonas sp. 707D4]